MTGIARRIVTRVALVLVATAIALKLADVAVRFIDPMSISHFTNKGRFDSTALRTEQVDSFQYLVAIPGADVQAGVRYQINSLGLRGGERSLHKQPETFRILALGDSVTFGWGVECEERFTDVVERRLNPSDRVGPAVEILNLSLPGYETVHHLQSWRRLGKDMQADVVVVVFNQNDVQLIADEVLDLQSLADARLGDRAFFARQLTQGPVAALTRAWLPSLRNLALFNFIFATTPADEQTLTVKFAGMADGIRNSLALLDKLKSQVEAQGARLALLDLQEFQAIREGCDKLGIAYRSICYDGYLHDRSLRNSPADPHPNAAGHLRLAERFEWALRDMHLLPGDTR